MKTKLTILFTIGSGLMILDSINPVHTLTLFLLAGVIPGTNLAIPAVDMMAAYATAFTVVVLRLAFWQNLKPMLFETKTNASRKAVKQN